VLLRSEKNQRPSNMDTGSVPPRQVADRYDSGRYDSSRYDSARPVAAVPVAVPIMAPVEVIPPINVKIQLRMNDLDCINDFKRAIKDKLPNLNFVDFNHQAVFYCIRRDDIRLLQEEYRHNLSDSSVIVIIFHNDNYFSDIGWNLANYPSGIFLGVPSKEEKFLCQINYKMQSILPSENNQKQLNQLSTNLKKVNT